MKANISKATIRKPTIVEAFNDVCHERKAYLDAALDFIRDFPEVLDIVTDAKKEKARIVRSVREGGMGSH